MPARVYTQRLAYARGEGTTVTYEVPEGFRAVVRNVICQCTAVGDGYHLYTHGYYAWRFLSQVAFDHNTFETRLVLYERETMTVVTFGPSASVLIAGQVFEDPDGKPSSSTTVRNIKHPEQMPIDLELPAGGGG